MKKFRENEISAMKKIDKIKAMFSNPDTQEEKIKSASLAAYSLWMWVLAVVKTYDALLIVEPKRKELAGAEQSL